MFYHLFTYLDTFDFPGAGMFNYISFRASMAFIMSLLVGLFIGKKIIRRLQIRQIGEEIRDLGLEGQMQKKGTPTMGGIIILISLLSAVFAFANLTNVYVILMVVTTIWLGMIGFFDDYIKVYKKNKEGLRGIYKIVGQVILGLIVGLTLWLHPSVVVREHNVRTVKTVTSITDMEKQINASENYVSRDVKSTVTTIPFVKGNEFDYESLVLFLGEYASIFKWIIFIIAVIFITTAVSNGANITDGLDGLASGTSAIIVSTLGIIAYLSGNIIFSAYLGIMYIPGIGELVVFLAAFLGALIGFLWYNTYPAQVFMGDTGSLSIGGIIAVSAIIARKELLLPLLCGIFFIENLSVIIQVSYFKYTKRKYGVGKRVFLMSPLHHHYQKQGYPEAKIVSRFWIIGIFLAVLTLATLKMR